MIEVSKKGYKVYPESIIAKGEKTYFLAKKNLKKFLVSNDPKFELQVDTTPSFNVFKTSHNNALMLRKLFKHLNPQPCGLKKSFGFGDRLGLATPGHIKALKDYDIFPILAQQSIRELERTNRTMNDVIDDAMWGVFQTGYKNDWGADIDHVKNEEDILKALDCGFTMFTIDSLDINHITKLYNLIEKRVSSPFEFEVSIDEVSATTTQKKHISIVENLRQKKVKFTSLALKFVGKFEKGIDYIGNRNEFEKDFLNHLAICKKYGGYKLSIHSGSDKFSIYPTVKKAHIFHVKTSGTSWLEAIRLIAVKNPQFLRMLYQNAIINFEESCRNYSITIRLNDTPTINQISDKNLPELLDNPAFRQLFHISYGILLKNMGDKIYNILALYEEDYHQLLKNHLHKHIKALS